MKRKFRACIYVDIFVDEKETLEEERQEARNKLEIIVMDTPNSYSNYNAATMDELINNPDCI